jgi:hypothetical protein
MYLAGLIADDAQMTKKDLQRWADQACGPLAGSTVPGVAAGSPYAREVALEWIESEKELVAVAGWGTLSGLVSVKDDMNGFVISVGCYVPALTNLAKQVAEKVGPVTVDMGSTACQVPFAPDYIRKVEKRGAIGKKRKSAKC